MEWDLPLYLDNVMNFLKYLIEAEEHIGRLAKTAKRLGVDISDLKDISDHDLHVLLKTIGKHDSVPDNRFNKKELQMGIDVELEHTKSKLLAKLIAKDHLSEISDYYTRLKKMEAE